MDHNGLSAALCASVQLQQVLCSWRRKEETLCTAILLQMEKHRGQLSMSEIFWCGSDVLLGKHNTSLILYFCSCFGTSESSLLRRLLWPLNLCVPLLLILIRKVFTSRVFDVCNAFPLELESKTWRTFKAINTNICENRMMFFKGYIKIRETAVPKRN